MTDEVDKPTTRSARRTPISYVNVKGEIVPLYKPDGSPRWVSIKEAGQILWYFGRRAPKTARTPGAPLHPTRVRAIVETWDVDNTRLDPDKSRSPYLVNAESLVERVAQRERLKGRPKKPDSKREMARLRAEARQARRAREAQTTAS